MSQMAHVVDGEASESESEIEIATSPDVNVSTTNTEPFVIPGEAPESDDESKLSSARSAQAPSLEPLPPASPRRDLLRATYNSLLHQKLWECNVRLRANVEGLLRHTTEISVEKLSRTDKTLLQVQESMRATNANLTLARARLRQMRGSLAHATGLAAAALPTLRVKPSPS